MIAAAGILVMIGAGLLYAYGIIIHAVWRSMDAVVHATIEPAWKRYGRAVLCVNAFVMMTIVTWAYITIAFFGR